jgi:hypothetical protein
MEGSDAQTKFKEGSKKDDPVPKSKNLMMAFKTGFGDSKK